MTGWRLGYGVMRSDLAAHIRAAGDEFDVVYGDVYADCRSWKR